jgi:trehalose synthase-fused probable maltokinase
MNQITLTSVHPWEGILADTSFVNTLITRVLPSYINTCRWFAGKARTQEGFDINTSMAVPLADGSVAYILIVEVAYPEGDKEFYQLPVSFIDTSTAGSPEILPKGIISSTQIAQNQGVLIDACYDERFQQAIFQNLSKNQTIDTPDSKISFERGKGLATQDINTAIESRLLPVDSSNTAFTFGDKYFLKLYRKLFSQTNPEVEMVSFLTQYSDFPNIPAYAGSFVWQQPQQADVTLGMMQLMVQNQQDTWSVTGDHLNDFMYGVPKRLFSVKEEVFEEVALLGQRTAEMHLGLYAPEAEQDFAPEKFTSEYRQFLYKRFEDLLNRRYNLLIDNYLKLDKPSQKLAWEFMEAKEMLDDFIAKILTRPLDSLRIRIHGDYHLGQVLATASDYIIIDFEGEPESSIAERKIKHSPLKDVAGMIRSYHYAVCAKLYNSEETKNVPTEKLLQVSDRWYRLIRDTFLETYYDTFGYPHPLFKDNTEVNFLMLLYLLEKAVYELGYEISYRPDWVKIPLKGIVDVIREIEKLRN